MSEIRFLSRVLHERPRRRWAGVALAVLLVVYWGAVQVAWQNPRRLIVLKPLSYERVTWVIVGVAVALALATMLVGLRRKLALVLSAVALVPVLLVTGVVVVGRALHADADPGFEKVAEAVVGRSDDGRFRLVSGTYRGDEDADFWYEEYHVESAAGARSRTSDFFAVLDHPLQGDSPRITEARFAGERAIEVTTSDGRRWTFAFDPDEVQVSHWLRNCDDRDDLCWTPIPEE